MALSFGDSVGKIKNSTLKPTAAMTEVFSDIREENFTKSDKYEWYDSYHDENFSIVNQDKSISVDSSQINLTQETNSQFIPFELPRYYDGIDLMEMSFRIHYVNADKNEYYSTPINVTYSDTSIRFGWLVDNYATSIEGLLQFEITANGVNEKGDNYIWKSRPDGKINILKSLTGNAPVKPDEDWYTQFITMIDSKVAEARQEALSAKASADKAIEASDAAQNVVDNAKQEILDQVSGSLEQQLSTALEQYYDKEEVNALIKNIDLTEALKDINNKIDNIDGLAKFKVEYNENTKTISFYNGEVLIKSVTIDTSPSSEWVTSYNGIVDAKIQKGIEPVTQELQQFKTSTQKDLEGIHSEVDGLPENLNTDFYKKPEINTLLEQKAPLASVEEIKNKVGVMESSVKQVEENVTQLGNDFTELEEVVNKINQKPSNEYEATYEDNVFTLLENGQVKNQFTITGGSGGGDSTIDMEMCGFKRYYLSDGSNKRTSMSFLAKHLLSVDKAIGVGSSNEGGWATTSLNTFLNTRLYEAFPVEYRQLLKQVRISSSIGNQSNDISTSDCYIHIPSAYEVDPTMTSEPYIYEGTPITYLTTNESRICSYDGGNSHPYWLRSPNISYSTYYYRVENTGTLSGYYYPYNEDGIRIMFSV